MILDQRLEIRDQKRPRVATDDMDEIPGCL